MSAYQHTEPFPAIDKTRSDFLIKDYELKIRYLTDHFSRMWTRFNFFVGVESAVIGGKVVIGDGKLSTSLSILGAAVALMWYVMGAEDRFLVDLYRDQVRSAGQAVADVVLGGGQPYVHVGEVKESAKQYSMSPISWRVDAISTTHLAAWIPLLVFAGWVVAALR